MTTKFKEKQILAEILNDLYAEVNRKEESVGLSYKPVGEEQAKDWRTGELQWEDEDKTIPKMTAKWDNVPKTEEELTEEDKIRIRVCQHIKSLLEKML